MKIRFAATVLTLFGFLALLVSCNDDEVKTAFAKAETVPPYPKMENWNAQIITAANQKDTVNAWTVYSKNFELAKTASDVYAHIAVDSKYWLWINGEIIVREGGLKRGPSPQDTYYDTVPLGEYLVKGQNKITLLVQHFGKNGFSHNSSGLNGLLFEMQVGDTSIISNNTWKAWPHSGFGQTGAPFPNYRLPESNTLFNAQLGNFDFTLLDYDASMHPNALIVGPASDSAWNALVQRPIPMWKDFGLLDYVKQPSFPFIASGDTLKLKLPYNAQVTPYFKINATAGDSIHISTDHYRGGGVPNVRAVYIARDGTQEYEVFGWINGEEVHYIFPQGVEVLDLKYRETGYDTNFKGSFTSNDPFYNKLWDKSLRTLYITMRDTYMDCPDRERAQWWGDAVLESGEAFYALDRRADLLMKKGMYELMNWQRADSTIFSPVPAGNWNQELPGQMLSSVGYYGFYNYYLHTGDIEPIAALYEPVKKYLEVYKLQDNGVLVLRNGGWYWGDWGQHKDMELLLNTQYYIALQGLLEMARALNNEEEVNRIEVAMQQFKRAFNQQFWKGDHYRGQDYKGMIDDRSQALAVVAGLAPKESFPAIYKVLKTQRHASPYMEKYVVEALFKMNQPDFALIRLKERFDTMVNYEGTSTLWEGWGIGKEGYGGGTTNHAWSGGGLTLLSQYVAGISPTTAGYATFQVKPQVGFLNQVTATVPSIKGEIKVAIDTRDQWSMQLIVPAGTMATVYIPSAFAKAELNNKEATTTTATGEWHTLQVPPGEHLITAR